ncbi:MAG: hypothetical protein V1921_06240 [Candidatus Altiarchaeota archaeon]
MTRTKIVKLKLDESGTADRLPQLRDNALDEVVEKAVQLFGETEMPTEWRNDAVPQGRRDCPWKYKDLMLEEGRKLDVTSDQLQTILTVVESRFSDQKGFSERLGLFLTGLIEGSTSNEFRIKPTTLITDLCYHLKADKKVTVEGDIGDDVCFQMAAGRVHIKGNAGESLGQWMNDGHIIVDGNAGRYCGVSIKDGKIEVGGEIAEKYYCSREGGEVWEKGKRIFPRVR